MPTAGGLSNVVGLRGRDVETVCRLDDALGGGAVSVTMDRPTDHLVMYASPMVASVEPQLARSWKNGEEASWEVRYRWLPS